MAHYGEMALHLNRSISSHSILTYPIPHLSRRGNEWLTMGKWHCISIHMTQLLFTVEFISSKYERKERAI